MKLAFMLTNSKYVRIFERWAAISNMVAWRNAAGTSDVAYWQVHLAQFITIENVLSFLCAPY